MMKKSFWLLLLSTGLMSHCLEAAQAEPSDQRWTVPGKLGTRLEMFEKQVDPVPSLIPSSLSSAPAHQTGFSTATADSKKSKKPGPPVSPRPGRSTTTALPTATPTAIEQLPVHSAAPTVGVAEPFVSSITRDETLANAGKKAEMPALTGIALATENQQNAARIISFDDDDLEVLDLSGVLTTDRGVLTKAQGAAVMKVIDLDDDDEPVAARPAGGTSILSGADVGVAVHGEEERQSVKSNDLLKKFRKIASLVLRHNKIKKLLDTINRRRQLEEAEGELLAGDAVWLLAPENQNEVLRKQILQVIGDNHDKALSSLTAYFEFQGQAVDDALYGYINQFIFPSQSGDEAQALVKDIKRFDRARELLVEHGTQAQTLDTLVTRHKEQLNKLIRQWQGCEHVAKLQSEQIKECLRRLVNGEHDYFLSDGVAGMMALKLGDLQASMAEHPVSSPIVNEIFTSANKKFSSLRNRLATQSQEANFFGMSYRPGVMRIETELSQHVSQLKTEIKEILQQNGQVMLTPVQLQSLVQTAMLASGADDESRVKLRDDEIKTIAARIGELYESE